MNKAEVRHFTNITKCCKFEFGTSTIQHENLEITLVKVFKSLMLIKLKENYYIVSWYRYNMLRCVFLPFLPTNIKLQPIVSFIHWAQITSQDWFIEGQDVRNMMDSYSVQCNYQKSWNVVRTSFKYSSRVKVPMFVFTLQFEKSLKQGCQKLNWKEKTAKDFNVLHLALNMLPGSTSSNMTVKTCHALLSLLRSN